ATGGLDGRHFISFVATVLFLYGPAKQIGRNGHYMVLGLAGAERVFELLDVPNEIVDRPGARELTPLRDAITFDDVTFRYAGDGTHEPKTVLDRVGLTVKRGEVVAVV